MKRSTKLILKAPFLKNFDQIIPFIFVKNTLTKKLYFYVKMPMTQFVFFVFFHYSENFGNFPFDLQKEKDLISKYLWKRGKRCLITPLNPFKNVGHPSDLKILSFTENSTNFMIKDLTQSIKNSKQHLFESLLIVKRE